MIIDNLELIRPLINCQKPYEFYYVQVIARSKENPELKNKRGANIVKEFIFQDIKELEDKYDTLKLWAHKNNARIYINLTPRNSKRIAIEVAKEILGMIENDNFKKTKRLWTSVCAKTQTNLSQKYWFIDIDEDVFCKNPFNNITIYAELKTPNGWHLVCKPFPVDWIPLNGYPNFSFEVKKNQPVLLYYCDEKENEI